MDPNSQVRGMMSYTDNVSHFVGLRFVSLGLACQHTAQWGIALHREARMDNKQQLLLGNVACCHLKYVIKSVQLTEWKTNLND